MNAADIMTKAVVTVPPNAPLHDALRLMLGQRISGLPVIDTIGRVVGILTEGDLLRRAEIGTEARRSAWTRFVRGPAGQAEDYVRTHARRVDEIMTRDVVTATATAPLVEIVAAMERRHIKQVPIVVHDRLIGIISRADLLRALSAALEPAGAMTDPAGAPSTDDGAISRRVEAELRAQPWCRGNRVDAVVADGVVFLEGFVSNEREHEAIRVAAENVPGVKAVEDHIEFINPNLALAYGG